MKRIAIISIFLLNLIFISPAYAAPCYGTKLPKRRGFSTGAQTYAIFNKKLEDSYGEIRSTQHFWLISYGVFDWLSLDLKGGAGNIKQHPLGQDEADYPSSFAGGYGVRFKLYEQEAVKAVFGFQHISVHPRKIHLEEVKNRAILDDWQVSLLGSYEFSKITPYLGVRWTRIDYIHKVDEIRKRKMSNYSSKPIGIVAGFDVALDERTWLNFEGQFLDGEAASFSLNFSF